MTDILAVLVFIMPDGMATPTDDQIRLPPGLKHPGIAQDVKDIVGQILGIVTAETCGRLRDRIRIDNVPQN